MRKLKPDMKPNSFLILAIIMIALCTFMIVLAVYIVFLKQPPDDLKPLACAFSSHKIQGHYKSSSTDLLLHSPEYEKEFKISFYSDCEEYLPNPELLCNGELFNLQVSEAQDTFSIYGISDSKGNIFLTPEIKNELYRNGQMPYAIITIIIFTTFIVFWSVGIPVHYHPEYFHPVIRKIYFYKKKSI